SEKLSTTVFGPIGLAEPGVAYEFFMPTPAELSSGRLLGLASHQRLKGLGTSVESAADATAPGTELHATTDPAAAATWLNPALDLSTTGGLRFRCEWLGDVSGNLTPDFN